MIHVEDIENFSKIVARKVLYELNKNKYEICFNHYFWKKQYKFAQWACGTIDLYDESKFHIKKRYLSYDHKNYISAKYGSFTIGNFTEVPKKYYDSHDPLSVIYSGNFSHLQNANKYINTKLEKELYKKIDCFLSKDKIIKLKSILNDFGFLKSQEEFEINKKDRLPYYKISYLYSRKRQFKQEKHFNTREFSFEVYPNDITGEYVLNLLILLKERSNEIEGDEMALICLGHSEKTIFASVYNEDYVPGYDPY